MASAPGIAATSLHVNNAVAEVLGVAILFAPPSWAWGDAVDDDFRVRTLSGGITNCLYQVQRLSRPREAVLVRLYGAGTEALIDRAADTARFALLARLGFGPACYGAFANGRVEGYVPSRALEPQEMALRTPIDVVGLIASETARMHELAVGPLDAPGLWPRLDGWRADIGVEGTGGPADVDLPWLTRELAWLKGVLPSPANGHGTGLLLRLAEHDDTAAPALHSALAGRGLEETSVIAAPSCGSLRVPVVGSPAVQARIDGAALMFRVVFGHNDLLAGNILLLEKEDAPLATESDKADSAFSRYRSDRLQLIDYEYGGVMYCGFDLGNHFCEHAGFDFDLARWYPSRATQEAWLRAYVAGLGLRMPSLATYGSGAPVADGAEDDVSAAFVHEALVQANRFALASHMWWGQWALLQARCSAIDFDFAGYSRLRMAAYRAHKAQLFPDEQVSE
jgi:ethanolamine kinase